MTAARHRAERVHPSNEPAPAVDADISPGGGTFRGGGPRGMWWVAWRQHRIQVTATLVLIAIIAAALVAFRLLLAAHLHAAGCSVAGQHSCPDQVSVTVWDGFENSWRILHAVLIAAPIALGVFVGAPIFPREFEQRTQIFALTQSVGRMRWSAAKVTLVGTPLLLGLLGLGFLAGWVDKSSWLTSGDALYDGYFQVRAIMPAAFGLVALAIAVTAGIVVRSVVPSLVAALIVAGGLVFVIAFPLRPHLLPATRDVVPIDTAMAQVQTPDAARTNLETWFLGSGYLDAGGHEVAFDFNGCTLPNQASPGTPQTSTGGVEATNSGGYAAATNKCMHDQGIVAEYTDTLPAGMLWPLRLIVTGICIALAALVLALGALRLRAPARSGR